MAITKLKRVAIHNYKSLRFVELFPSNSDFTVLVGRNGSGKTNLSDAFDFLKLVYLLGLEHAVARKGGYENIAHRKERRSRTAMQFEVEMSMTVRLSEIFPEIRRMHSDSAGPAGVMHVKHSFSFRATGQGIRSEFVVIDESLTLNLDSAYVQQDLFGKPSDEVVIRRGQEGKVSVSADVSSRFATAVLFDPKFWFGGDVPAVSLPPTELLTSFPYLRSSVPVGRFCNWLQRMSVFQLSPETARSPGVPTPNPSLSSRGENLPAVVDWMQRNHPSEWASVENLMRDIVPEIESITVDYLHTRTLGLYFRERGVGRSWTAEEVSDGTIRSLAILVACYDPRASLLFIEEPENSLHPWIIKVTMKGLRRLSAHKPVLLTTHSPLVLNSVSPDEVCVVYKRFGETAVAPLGSFDQNLQGDWESGRYRLFDYIDAGFISEAVPSGGDL